MIGSKLMKSTIEAEDVGKVRQPASFDRFHCIGADCEDTCCVGWGIVVDQATYEKYQNLPGHRIADKTLVSLVEINPARTAPGNHAKLRLEGARCPAFQEGLCAIQKNLGESHIPDLCSKYPRVLNVIGGTLERSLHLSCPEAARLVLNDPDAMVLQEHMEEPLPHRPSSLAVIAGEPDDRIHQVRTVLIEMIQERSLPLWERIVSLGLGVDRLADIDIANAVPVLENYRQEFRQGSLNDVFTRVKADPSLQLVTVVELVLGRIGTDYTSPRFLECYKDFMRGLAWTAESTIEDLTARYCFAYQNYFLPFQRRHEHMLENYLANYIFRTIFPYRSRLPDRGFAIDRSSASIRHSFVLLAVHYAIIRTLLIGMAAFYKENLNVDAVVTLVQSYSKAFLHSSSFEAAAIEHLTKNFGDAGCKIAELVMDPFAGKLAAKAG